MDTKERNKKSRCYCTILYPESAAPNWLQIIENLHIKIMISPLHDRDLNEDDTPKKPHYHIMFLFPSVKSREQIREITDSLGCVGIERVLDPTSMALYFTHQNAPDKTQYPAEDVICFGCDYSRIIARERDTADVVGEIIDYIEAEHPCSFAALVRYCRLNNQREWLKCIYGRSYFFVTFMKSIPCIYTHEHQEVALNTHKPLKNIRDDI